MARKSQQTRPMGRPKRQYTDAQIRRIKDMARSGCRTGTIAAALGLPDQTIRDNFQDMIIREHAEHRNDLYVAQNKAALVDRNPAMLIFLGKNELGQADKKELDVRLDKLDVLLGDIDGLTRGLPEHD